jgi:hypothetical protein
MNKRIYLPVALLSLVALSGCKPWDWFNRQTDQKDPQVEKTTKEGHNKSHNAEKSMKASQEKSTSQANKDASVVVTAGGEAIVTEEDFKQSLDAIAQANPGMLEVLPMMPKEQQQQMYNQILESLVAQHLEKQYVKEQKLDQTQDYKKNRKQLLEQVEQLLADNAFKNDILENVSVSEKDAQAYYDKNKASEDQFQQPPFLKAQGGTKAHVVRVASKKAANDLAEQARQSGNLKQAAKDAGKKVDDLGVVTQESSEPSYEVVSKINEMKKLPNVVVVESDDVYYVAKGLSKAKPEYAKFADVKDEVLQAVKNERFQKQYMEKLESLKKKYDVSVNQAFVNSLMNQPEQEAAQEKADKQQNGAQQAKKQAEQQAKKDNNQKQQQAKQKQTAQKAQSA